MGFGIDINVFGNIECCYFCEKWKMQHFYIKNVDEGGLTPVTPFGYATGLH